MGTASITLVATASAIATAAGDPQRAASVAEIVSTSISGLLLLSAIAGGIFAYWRYRISALDKLVEVFDTESHAVKLWNMSQVIRGGSNGLHVFYDPGYRELSPRAWDAEMQDAGWRVISPNLQKTSRTWDEPYRSLFSHGFGPGYSLDGTSADFSRFAWLIRQIAVACGCGSNSPVEKLLRPWLVRYLRRVTGSQVSDALTHFEVVVSRLIRFLETEGPDEARWEIDREYYWRSYGFDAPLYLEIRTLLQPQATDDPLYEWIAVARGGFDFQPVSSEQFRVWSKQYVDLLTERELIPLL